jgi:hypothetical protein
MNKLPLMAGCGVIPMGNCDCECECDYTCLTLTKTQDVANRASYNETTGVLNLPPAIVARRQQLALGIFVPEQVWIPIAGLEQIVIDTTGGAMAPVSPDDRLLIPRNGHFNLNVHAQVESDSDGVLLVRMVVVGTGGFVRTVTAPVVMGMVGGADVDAPVSPRSVGDTVQVALMTTCPSGMLVNTVSIAAEYVEGT